MSLPFWKIKREAIRVAQQLKGLPDRLSDPIRSRTLDRAVESGLPRVEGEVPLRRKVAVLLMFQPNGVSGSFIEQCAWLVANGFAPFVVANHPLGEEDRSRLAPVIWRGVSRPNFGYDFGGYRDALTTLRQWRVMPETLLILNDSVWVPVRPGADLLKRLEECPADIAGSILRVRNDERFLESYCFRIKGHLLSDPAFLDFWSTLRLTSNKYYVIRRGERGFSRAMRDAGFSVAAVYDPDGLDTLLKRAAPEMLRKTLTFAAFLPEELERERHRLLREDETEDSDWRERALALVRRTLADRQGYSSLPYAASQLLDYPFLKKSRDRTALEWRRAVLAAVDAGELPEPPGAILAELRARVLADNLH